jgi:hypothetical protein
MLATRVRPKLKVNPLAKKKRRAAIDKPFKA